MITFEIKNFSCWFPQKAAIPVIQQKIKCKLPLPVKYKYRGLIAAYQNQENTYLNHHITLLVSMESTAAKMRFKEEMVN